jgi:5-methylcytosine-specific restriction endonuclease McrA
MSARPTPPAPRTRLNQTKPLQRVVLEGIPFGIFGSTISPTCVSYAICEHPTASLEIGSRLNRAGAEEVRWLCLACGQTVGPVIGRQWRHLATCKIASADELEERFERARAAASKLAERYTAVTEKAVAERDMAEREKWRAQHAAYLATPEWKRRRALVMKRAAGVCEGCGTAPAREVHHLTYARWQRELLFDLVAVCRACHLIAHDRNDGVDDLDVGVEGA